MVKTELAIVGAGGFGREVAAMILSSLGEKYDLKGFVDDHLPQGSTVNELPVLGDLAWVKEQRGMSLVLAIAAPAIRQKIRVELGDFHFPNIIHPGVSFHQPEYISMGDGNIICEGNILTTNISIGHFNIINLACTIGHDTVIGNYCSIMPGVNISGGAKLQNGVYVGTGAKLIKSTVLFDDCTVGAGAVINTDVPEGETFAGVPAKNLVH